MCCIQNDQKLNYIYLHHVEFHNLLANVTFYYYCNVWNIYPAIFFGEIYDEVN